LPFEKSCLQKWLAKNRSFGHLSLMSRNGEGRNPDSEAQFQQSEVCPCGSGRKHKRCCGGAVVN